MGTSVRVMDEGEIAGMTSHRPRWRKKRYAVPGLSLLTLLAVFLMAWANRESIAHDFIRDQFDAYGIEGTYQIERIGGQTQVISDLVIGDPAAPDLTAKQAVVKLKYRLGLPQIGSITLVEPRLYATYLDGQLSFGSLDPLVFAESEEEPGLPAFNVAIRDGRGLLETDYGPVGFKLEGKGPLDNGFTGIFAAVAPDLAIGGCEARQTTLYGLVSTDGGAPEFSGPLRQQDLTCEENGIRVAGLVAELDAAMTPQLSDPSIEARIDTDALAIPGGAAQSLAGTIRAQIRGDDATTRFSLAARGFETPQAIAAVMTAEGVARGRGGFKRLEVDGNLEGNGLRLGSGLVAGIESLSQAGEGTLVEPIVRKIAAALQAQTRGSSLEARIRYRQDAKGYSLLIPQAELAGGEGARILSLSRVQIGAGAGEGARFSGNIATGGPGLPSISGRMENNGGAGPVFRLSMAPYEAGGSTLAVPRMSIVQGAGGAFGFSGQVEATGPVPGGAVDGLSVPVSGRYGADGALALWRDCTRIVFRRIAFADLNIAGPGLTLCPPPGRPMLRSGPAGIQFAAGAPSLDLKGSLADTPIRIASGPVGFAWPGTISARNLAITLGPAETASRFVISDLDARVGDNIAGTFSDADIRLASVPLDISNAAGNWDYTGGVFTIGNASLRVADREEQDRFQPLVADGGTLTLRDSIIDARAELRDPYEGRLITIADIRHNLGTGAGYAALDVPGIVFDETFQPSPSSNICIDGGEPGPREPSGLSCLALGVVANAEGTVTGRGRIDWDSDGEVTSTGTFSTDDFDFAAAFGPVEGASGTIEFTDLLGLTTAPGQKLRVASINPGVEVLDGEIKFELRGGEVLAVAGGSWPFMGGRLILREVDFRFGVEEERRYIFEIVGLDAAQFVAQMEFENISATGTFDGTVPIVFDENGNGRIDEGILLSRPPGGNISYVGELTYEDLSPVANYAFDALRSMNFTQMRVVMEGPLAGEIVTRVRFDGVSQGEGAKKNFVTRQLAKLPIQFRINIRAQFYQLLTSLKALYDPAAVRDPRELGLLSDDGTRFLRRSVTGEEVKPEIDPDDVIPDEPTIQDQESE